MKEYIVRKEWYKGYWQYLGYESFFGLPIFYISGSIGNTEEECIQNIKKIKSKHKGSSKKVII